MWELWQKLAWRLHLRTRISGSTSLFGYVNYKSPCCCMMLPGPSREDCGSWHPLPCFETMLAGKSFVCRRPKRPQTRSQISL